MKNTFLSFFFVLLCISAKSQCEFLAIQVSSSDTMLVQLYHAGFFNLPSGFDNVCEWEVTEFSGTIVHQATTSGGFEDQSFMLFNHTVSITDSMKVKLVVSNATSGLTCEANDTLFWEKTEILPGIFIGNWAILSDNPGEEITLSLDTINTGNVSCYGGNDGSISVIAAGGDAPYIFSIDNGPFTPSSDFANLGAGEHTIVVNDNNGNTKSLTVILSEPDEVVVEVFEENVSCFGANDGEIVALVSGGTSISGYTFFINDEGPFTSGVFSDLVAGTYEIIVEDDNACIINTIVDIAEPEQMDVDNIMLSHLDCPEDTTGSISFEVSGGTSPFTYSYTDQQSTATLPITGLSAGNYMITVSDQNSCTFVFDFEILAPDTLVLAITALVNDNCDQGNNGSILLAAEGGTPDYTYSIGSDSNTTGQFDNLSAGDYTASLEDGNGCTVEVIFTIGLEIDLDVDYEISNPSCTGDSTGSIFVMVNGGNDGYTFFLNQEEKASSEFMNLAAGMYEIKIEGTNGCVFTDSITISQPVEITLNDLVVSSPQCPDDINGQIQFTISGGTGPYQTYFDGDTMMTINTVVFNEIGAGQLTFSIEDSLGCILNETLTVDYESTLSIDSINVYNVNCTTEESGTVEIFASGDSNIVYFMDSLTNTTGIFENLEEGTYTASVMDSTGCILEEQVNIIQEGLTNATITEIQNISCFGIMDGEATISIVDENGGYEFQLDSTINTTGTFTNLSAGEYLVIITNQQNCTSEIEFVIQDIEPLLLELVNLTGDDGTGNGSITLDASGGSEPYEYSIDSGVNFQIDSLFSNLNDGIYTTLVKDKNNCTDSLIITLITTTIQELDIDASIKIYPSPAELGSDINITSEYGVESILIANTQGQIIEKRMFDSKDIRIQTTGFVEGIYFFGIKTKQGFSWQKVLLIK